MGHRAVFVVPGRAHIALTGVPPECERLPYCLPVLRAEVIQVLRGPPRQAGMTTSHINGRTCWVPILGGPRFEDPLGGIVVVHLPGVLDEPPCPMFAGFRW